MDETTFRKLQSAWEDFVHAGNIDHEVVRPVVAASWKRCRQLGISPYAPKTSVKLSEHELLSVLDHNKTLIEVALPFMDFLKTEVGGTGFILVLTDAEGIVLETLGDEEVLKAALEVSNYTRGCCRIEEEFGTNAIGLAILSRAPVQLSGPEHYNIRHHEWTCATAPIFDVDGHLIGTITLSGRSSQAHPHTQGMVVSAAEGIGTRLKQIAAALEKSRSDMLLSSVLQSISEAILTVDSTGVVRHMNDGAARLLSVQPRDVVGQNVQRLFPSNPYVLTAIRSDKESGPLELTVDSERGRSYCIAKVLRIQQGEAGAILSLTASREFFNNVREMSGFTATFRFEDLVGKSQALLRQIELAKVAAKQDCRVLITGETGTGKELFAQAIHNHSSRRNGPFVAINCAAIPRELLESEIFGYRAGAFTGARKTGQVGKLELADGGSIFLDEISQMSLDLQAKLLRVLQDGLITRLGDSKPVKVNVRIIAATNEDLYEKSRNREFRQDLYFRLSVIEVLLPPLRERTSDIPSLAEHILSRIAAKVNNRDIVVSDEAMELLKAYSWPGNIREMENVLEMAAILCEGDVIEPRQLAHRLKAPEVETRLPSAVARSLNPAGPFEVQQIREVEIDVIRATMKEFQGNVALVSRKLGISRSTIYRRMKEYGINRSVQVE